ncbi:MAG TPA: hypothetical protein ENJ32_09140 [Crenotrichaceae bacterium]|nr:hypothetical protein [Crenotrichaceae bacterium]
MQTQHIPTQKDFVMALSEEILVLTGYGVHAYLSPHDISDCYSKFSQSTIPLRTYAQSVINNYKH